SSPSPSGAPSPVVPSPPSCVPPVPSPEPSPSPPEPSVGEDEGVGLAGADDVLEVVELDRTVVGTAAEAVVRSGSVSAQAGAGWPLDSPSPRRLATRYSTSPADTSSSVSERPSGPTWPTVV